MFLKRNPDFFVIFKFYRKKKKKKYIYMVGFNKKVLQNI